MNKAFSPRTFFIISAIFIAAFSRFIPHPNNFTALGAIALFAGATLNKRWLSLIVPMAAMFITDMYFGFHPTMWATYGSMALITMIGWAISGRQNVKSIAIASVVSVFLFFVITNGAMWVVSFYLPEPFYSTDAKGLANSFIEGLPFLTNSMISQVLYTGLLFGAFHAARVYRPSLVRA